MPGSVFTARTVDIQWRDQPGRSRFQRHSVAEGYRGRYPYASVAVVAQSTGQDSESADYTASAIRDTFAEGVAFAPGEALVDALDEAGSWISAHDLDGCTVAAAAVMDSRVWFCWIGNCRVYHISGGSVRLLTSDHSVATIEGLSPGDPAFRQKARETTACLGSDGVRPGEGRIELCEGDSLLLLTSGVWLYIDESLVLRKSGRGASLSSDLSELLHEARTGHRRQGGAAAGFRLLSSTGSFVRIPGWLGAMAVGICLVLAALFFSGVLSLDEMVPSEDQPFRRADSLLSEMVLPLPHPDEDTVAVEPVPAVPTLRLPVTVLVVGGKSLGVSTDTLNQHLTGIPDPQWENWTSGVYTVYGDSAVMPIAERLASGAGFDSVSHVEQIVVVRQGSASRFSSWLSGLDQASSAGTAVIVETTSSVAAGASWIRNYPIFINGDREMHAMHSCFRGDSLPGIPALKDDAAYRILVIPEM